MSVDDDIKKQIERTLQGSGFLTTTQPNALLRDSLSEVRKTSKSAGEQLTDLLAKTHIRVVPQIDQMEVIQKLLADSARAFQDRIDPLRRISQAIHDSQTQLARAAQIAFEPFVQMVNVAERLQTGVRLAFEPGQRIREAIAAIPTAQFLAFQKSFAGMADKLNLQWDLVERPVFRLFTKLGLTGLERHLTRSELLYILRLSKEKGTKAVPEYVFRKFRAEKYKLLNRMVRGWWRVPYMRKRRKAIRAAIGAHKKRQYELAIPALLPLIDGLAAEIVIGTPNLKKKTIYARDAAAIYNADEAEIWSECFEQVVFGLVFKDYDFRTAKKPPSSVNRHAILHGRIVDYGSELNSYRVILLLDVMVNIADDKTKQT
jgi:hypothetical protein